MLKFLFTLVLWLYISIFFPHQSDFSIMFKKVFTSGFPKLAFQKASFKETKKV